MKPCWPEHLSCPSGVRILPSENRQDFQNTKIKEIKSNHFLDEIFSSLAFCNGKRCTYTPLKFGRISKSNLIFFNLEIDHECQIRDLTLRSNLATEIKFV